MVTLKLVILFYLFLTAFAQTCPPGSFISSSGSCEKCPFNTISTLRNSTICTPCINQTAANRRQTACAPCGKGRIYRPRPRVNKVCAVCPFDFFNDQEFATSCTPCPPGTRGPRGGTSKDSCTRCQEGFLLTRRPGGTLQCVTCPPGSATFENQLLCLPCPPGTFHNRFGNGICRLCPPGLFASGMGNTFCTKCPIHEFTNEFGQSSCKTCPSGTEAPNTGARQCRPKCQDSDPGCVSCPPGNGVNSGGKCERCAEGFIGQIRTGTSCYPCPALAESNDARRKCICPRGLPPLLDGRCDRFFPFE